MFVVEIAQRHDVIYVFVVCTVQCCTYEHIFNFYLKKAPNSILYKYAKFVIKRACCMANVLVVFFFLSFSLFFLIKTKFRYIELNTLFSSPLWDIFLKNLMWRPQNYKMTEQKRVYREDELGTGTGPAPLPLHCEMIKQRVDKILY